jgi:hypothetical protein
MKKESRKKMTRMIIIFVVFTFIAGLLPMLFSI